MASVQRGLLSRDDVAHWDGVTRTTSRVDATGGTVTGLNFGDSVDVLQVFGDGTSRSEATINTAIGRLGGAAATFKFATGTWTIAANLTIPESITCYIPAGTVFSVDSGKTLTFSGLVITEDPSAWFSGSGTVTVSNEGSHFGVFHRTAAEKTASKTPTNFSYPQGFVLRYGKNTTSGTTDLTTAIQAAIDVMEAEGAGDVILDNHVMAVSDTLTINGPIWLRGAGASYEEIFTASPTFDGSVIKLITGSFDSASKAIIEFDYTGSGGEARLHAGASNMMVFGNRGSASNPTAGAAKDFNAFGIGFHNKGGRYVTLDHCHGVWCAEDGFKSISDGGTPPNNMRIIGGSYVSNADDGIDMAGGDSFITDVQCGFNGGDGITCGSIHLTSVRCWDNFSQGLRITTSDCNVTGGTFYDNEAAGILVSGTLERINICGATCQDNGKDTGLTNQERAGIYVSGNSSGSISGVVSGNKDENGTTGQKYGVRVTNTSSTMVVAGVTGEDNGIALVSDLGAGIFTANELRAGGIAVNTATPQTLNGAGAVSITHWATWITTTGTDALTLADGAEGQEKSIVMKSRIGDGTLTPDNLGNGSTITFDTVGDSAQLIFTNAAWYFMGGTATLA